MSRRQPNFALYYAVDGYSMAGKIMGRQSAGSGLIKGIARHWPDGEIACAGGRPATAPHLQAALRDAGHRGTVRWQDLEGTGVPEPGAIYYPAPPDTALAHARNARGTTSYSLFGVTHTLSSAGAMDQVAATALAPFQPWDALVCTSHAALVVAGRLQDDLRDWMREHVGATRFSAVQTPVIPLGIDAPSFAATPADRAAARKRLGLDADDVAFLFAGRLTFHAKANPAPFYQAVEAACRQTGRRLTVIEAGIYPGDKIREAFASARAALAPSARFIHVDGQDERRYRAAWRAADVFVSLSDNIQETFGLTPLEAMAAGLPVLVSDWDGYKDTVREGVDGYRVATLLPPGGGKVGEAIARRHAAGTDTYDRYIGRVSLGTVIDPEALAARTIALAADPALRRRLGAAGQARARAAFDWPVILDRYAALADELGAIRAAAPATVQRWPLRPDPFALFAHYPTATLDLGRIARVRDPGGVALEALLDLTVSGYSFDPQLLPRDAVRRVHHLLATGERTVGALLAALPADPATGTRDTHVLALMWLIKFGLVSVER